MKVQTCPENRSQWWFDTGNHVLVFDKRGDTLVCSFDPYGWPKDWSGEEPPRPWGDSFLTKNGYSVLGVLSKKPTWFREESLFRTFAGLQASGFFFQFGRVVFYGASKGGYGALAFSSYHPGSAVVVFSPQSTLHAPLVPFEDRDFPGFGMWTGSLIDGAREAMLASTVSIFYDPFHKIDRAHVERLQGKNIKLYKCNFFGHDVPPGLKSLGVLSEVTKRAIDGRLTRRKFYKLVRNRKKLRRFPRNLVSHLIGARRYELARRIIDMKIRRKVDINFYLIRKAMIYSIEGDQAKADRLLKKFDGW